MTTIHVGELYHIVKISANQHLLTAVGVKNISAVLHGSCLWNHPVSESTGNLDPFRPALQTPNVL